MKLTSLDKSLRIIELLSKQKQSLSLLEMSSGLGFPKSTIHHILSTFLLHDYIVQEPDTKKYFLGLKFLSIGKVILESMDIRKIANKYLRLLHEECNEAIHLAILRNGQVVYIDKIDKSVGLSLATYIGFATEPHAAAGGKVLLSDLSQKEIMDIYRNKTMKRYGKNTITNLRKLFRELKSVKKQGFAIDNEEYYEGIRCVAAPVRAGGQIAASISITGSVFTMTMERINQELKELVMKTAEQISSEMRW
jgi:IclR family KDG regulon transcriptional repressor